MDLHLDHKNNKLLNMDQRESRIIHGFGIFFSALLCITASGSTKRGSRGIAFTSGLFACALYYVMP